MSKTGYAIIGSGFGDEGKGLMTDYLARTLPGRTLNVRCNGGAQAGHTVVDGEKRHVFGHIGAATFANSNTWLSKRFIVNPFVLYKERVALKENFGITPDVGVHTDALVTTIYDVVLNGLRELSRGSNRHGSCGLGINETVRRSEHEQFRITANDLGRIDLDRIINIRDHWFKSQINDIDLTAVDKTVVDEMLTFGEPYFELHKLNESRNLFDYIGLPLFDEFDNVVFEGAQGLELDEFLGIFPHVTRSVTGLPSAIDAALDLGITEIHPIYVTRSYKTRHGAGPLAHENWPFSIDSILDKTNITSPWQGKLRYAPLDLQILNSFISKDYMRAIQEYKSKICIRDWELAVTHLDEVFAGIEIYDYNGDRKMVNSIELLDELSELGNVTYKVDGETANNVNV